MRARVAVPLVVLQSQLQVDVTVALERRLTRFIERQKFGERMGRCLNFLNAIAMYRSIQTQCDVLAVAGRLSNKFSTNHEEHATSWTSSVLG